MKCSTSLLLPVVAACGVALSSYGGTVVSDTWQDSDRTDPLVPTYSEYGVDGDLDGNIESSWWKQGAANTLTASPGHLVGSVAASSSSWSTWFTTPGNLVTLANPGDQLKVTWDFSMTGTFNAGNANQGLRLALTDSSQVARRTSDNSPADGVYGGYGVFMNTSPTLNQSNPFQLMERNPASAAFLSSSGAWTGLANSGTTGDPGYAVDTAYSFLMTLTLQPGNVLDIVARMSGAGLGPSGQGYIEVTYSDASPTLSYDLFGLRPATSSATATAFDTTLFQVEFSQIPEPTTFVLAGLGLLGVLGYRRMHR